MTDLKIDFDLLTASSTSLGIIDQAFDSLKSRRTATESDWGSSDISGALGSFAGDWDNHREKTMKSIESVKEMVDQALKQFTATEDQLKGSLQQDKTSSRVTAQ